MLEYFDVVEQNDSLCENSIQLHEKTKYYVHDCKQVYLRSGLKMVRREKEKDLIKNLSEAQGQREKPYECQQKETRSTEVGDQKRLHISYQYLVKKLTICSSISQTLITVL